MVEPVTVCVNRFRSKVIVDVTEPMVCFVTWDKGNDGWVSSVGSLSYNGSLAYDPATAQILRNAITAGCRGVRALSQQV